jgi:hypothetical protein
LAAELAQFRPRHDELFTTTRIGLPSERRRHVISSSQPVFAGHKKTMNSTTTSSKNVLNSDVEIKGNLKFDGELTFDGKLEGEIHTDGTLCWVTTPT